MRLSRSTTTPTMIEAKLPDGEVQMRTKHRSFQLEETMPGMFLLQGFVGGIVSGWVYIVAICLWDRHVRLPDALIGAAFMIGFASVAGVMKAILMWLPYRLLKIQPRASLRVALTSVATGVFAYLTGQLGSGSSSDLITWMSTLLVGGLPTAILVGSSIKPWDLFTFGTLAGERRRSVLRTLATLPLRFMSVLTLAFWSVYFANWVCRESWWSYDALLLYLAPTNYFLLSAYLTFRSPRKVLLFIIGLLANIPVAVLGYLAYEDNSRVADPFGARFYIYVICFSFIIAWAVFLIARLSVRTNNVRVPLTIPTNAQLTLDEHSEHHCLGSRVMEWQEHHA